MSKKAQAEPAPVDEFIGQGGSYEIDPDTGARRLVFRTLSRDEAAALAGAGVVVAVEGGV